ncbi:MAG: hypothetical protein KAQ68_10075, partial [Clostridiales bacterium]|nr:hypothetical protein [Clostridiales bacterium]
LTIVADAIIETDEGNFVELFMLFDENSRDSITWLYDLYPVSSSTPTITFTPTHSPSPTSTPYKYDKVEATLKNSGGISKDGTMQNVDVLIFNDMKDQITAITINDHEGNVLHEISGINSQDSVLTNLNVPYKEKLRLRVHYRLANGQKRRTLTNEIYTIKMDQSISDDDPVNVTLYIFIAVLFIIISTTIVIILRKKIKSE